MFLLRKGSLEIVRKCRYKTQIAKNEDFGKINAKKEN